MEYWLLLLRRKWIILISLIIAVAIGIAYVQYTTPIYQASGKLLLVQDGGMASLSGGMKADMMLTGIGKRADPLQTQIQVLKTRPMLQKVIDKLGLLNKEGKPVKPGSIRGKLTFGVIPNTNIIQMSCKHESPEVAAAILNALAEVFVETNRDLNKESATAAKLFIEKQLITQKDDLDSAETAIVLYKQKIGSVSMEQETTLKISRIAQLESQLITVESQLMGVYAERKEIEGKLKAPDARNSTLYSYWRSTLEEINTKVANIEAQKRSLVRKVTSKNRDLTTLPAQEIQYANLVRDREIAKNIYTQLLEQYEDFRIREAANISNIRTIEPAITPRGPIEPNKRKVVTLAALIGFLFGFGIALLLEYLDDSPKSIDEIKKTLPWNVLGAIPYVKKLSQLYTKDNNKSFAAESVRLIHTNMKFAGYLKKNHNAIMLTSSQPSEGKTTTSLNLAITYAQLGSKTAVINLDLRRPTFYKAFDRPYKIGLTDYLIEEATTEQIFYTHEEIPNLTIIPAGTIPSNPTAIIGTQRMMDLIGYLKNEFDTVIFDTPPVTMVAETLDIARHMDGIITVVGIDNASIRTIKHMGSLFENKKLPMLGTIINKMGKGDSRYYGGYGYGYGYGYGGGYGYTAKENEEA